jgi:hypothetical protein
MRQLYTRSIPILFFLLAVAGGAGPGCDLQHSAAPDSPPVDRATPPPTPAPPVAVFGCGLPRGAGDGRNCGREGADFGGAVATAIDRTRREHPEWFDGDIAVEVGRYVDETVDNLRRMGFCALNDGEEVAVKASNEFNEQYDIISSQGAVIQIYTATCRPAWSAIPPAGNDS